MNSQYQGNPFRDAYALMEARGWTQGEIEDPMGRVCLVGSLTRSRAARVMGLHGLLDAAEILNQVCREQYVKDGTYRATGIINDKMLTSKEEALAILDKAAVRWDEVNS